LGEVRREFGERQMIDPKMVAREIERQGIKFINYII
jgi:hypothetical protein